MTAEPGMRQDEGMTMPVGGGEEVRRPAGSFEPGVSPSPDAVGPTGGGRVDGAAEQDGSAKAAVAGFGPSALATPANALTVLRLLVSPLLFVRIADQGATWANFAVWTVLASTDGVDGWVARRHGTTRSGAFLDPLADKVLVLGALFALVQIDRFTWWPVAVIMGREIFISLLRVHYGRRGLAVPARSTAKAKTLVQALAIGLALAPSMADEAWVADGLLWVSVVLAMVSATQYVADGARAATTMDR
jgi:CDP-diacylglycerol--glycerol-3-phosphate 3-phosphatidyltransferase